MCITLLRPSDVFITLLCALRACLFKLGRSGRVAQAGPRLGYWASRSRNMVLWLDFVMASPPEGKSGVYNGK